MKKNNCDGLYGEIFTGNHRKTRTRAELSKFDSDSVGVSPRKGVTSPNQVGNEGEKFLRGHFSSPAVQLFNVSSLRKIHQTSKIVFTL